MTLDLAGPRAGGERALARTLSSLVTAPGDPVLASLLGEATPKPRLVALGLTGPPGVGESALPSAVVARLRARGRSA